MNQLKRFSAIGFAVLLMSAAGCMTTPPAHQESGGEYASDSWITTKVKAAFVEDSLVRVTEVNVETFKGVVQLSGFISSESAMKQAVRIASGIKGVNSVKNDMRIK
jgi:hyperosmotically inducible protein